MAKKSPFVDDLKSMKTNFKKAVNTSKTMFGSLDIDNGIYEADISGAELLRNRKSKHLQIRAKYVIIDGEYEGTPLASFMDIQNEDTLPFAVRWVNLMGFQFPEEEPELLIDILEEISEKQPSCQIEISESVGKDGRVYKNASLIKRYGVEDEGGEKNNAEPEIPESQNENTAILQFAQEFCSAQDVDFEPDDSLEILAERIAEFRWGAEDLSEEEIELFKTLDIEDKLDYLKASKKKSAKKK